MDAKLYMFPGSNAVLTAQLMLAHKGVEPRQVVLFPGPHIPALRLLGFPGTTVPAMVIDGRRIQGTRRISRALDELVPAAPLFPADPARRAAVEEAEQRGEAFADAVRRIFYCIGRRRPDAFRQVLVHGQPRVQRAILGRVAPAVIRGATLKHRASDAAGRADVAALPDRIAQVDAWIEAGVLGGLELNAADFQFGVNLALLLVSADLAPFVRGRPAQALADRVAPRYTGPIGLPLDPGAIPAALPAAWFADAPAAR